jgi:hypothetical protein
VNPFIVSIGHSTPVFKPYQTLHEYEDELEGAVVVVVVVVVVPFKTA